MWPRQNTVLLFVLQKQLEDYLNKLLRMAMYRKYHHTVSIHGNHRTMTSLWFR